MAKTLQMVFLNSAGKETVISVSDPKADLTLVQVQAVMQDIIDKNIFVIKGNTLAGQVEARISNRETVALV
jgi:hypothetical protein